MYYWIELTIGNHIVFQGRVRRDRIASQLQFSLQELVELQVNSTELSSQEVPIRFRTRLLADER